MSGIFHEKWQHSLGKTLSCSSSPRHRWEVLTSTDRNSGDRERGSTHHRDQDMPPKTTANDSFMYNVKHTMEMFWPHRPGPILWIRKEAIEWKSLGLLYVTSNTSTTPFKGSMELLTMTTFSPAQSSKFPEKTFKRSNVGFPMSIYFPLEFSKEEIKETRQEVAFILWSHYTPLGALVPKGKPLSWSDKKSCFLEDLSGHWNLQPSCQQDAGCLISSLNHNLCETPVAKTVKRWRESKMMDESIARLEKDEWVCEGAQASTLTASQKTSTPD